MKFIKFLCLPLVLIIALACNSEEVDVKKENFNSTIESSQKLYLEMMKTQDYEKYKEARNSFVAKLDNKLIFLKTKKDYMKWISNNLSSTKFSSSSEFEVLLDIMVSKYTILMKNNPKLYSYIIKADEKQFLTIVKPSLGKLPLTFKMNSCANTCMDACDATLNNIESGYGLLYAQYGGNAFTNAIIDAMYWSNYSSAIDDLNSCMSSC